MSITMTLSKMNPTWVIGVIILLAMFRLVPHPPNATPIAAMALFSGAVFSNRALAYLVPLAAMWLSDLVLGLHATIWYVYAGVAITVLIGSALQNITIFRVGAVAFLASIVFYLLTNFGAWLHHDMYPQNATGLLQAYVAGLPFLRNALLANLMFAYLVFYGLAWLKSVFSSSRSIPN